MTTDSVSKLILSPDLEAYLLLRRNGLTKQRHQDRRRHPISRSRTRSSCSRLDWKRCTSAWWKIISSMPISCGRSQQGNEASSMRTKCCATLGPHARGFVALLRPPARYRHGTYDFPPCACTPLPVQTRARAPCSTPRDWVASTILMPLLGEAVSSQE